MNHSLTVKNLHKIYGSRSVVNGVSLDAKSGEIIGVLGPNGAGKTTTFYSIIGLIKITSGEIHIDGHNIAKLPIHLRAKRGLSYLPQETSVFKKLSVADNLRIVAEYLLPKDQIDGTISSLLERFRLHSLSDQKAYTLSGGECRRLEIARTLISRPKFILLDEPFSGIDPISIADIRNILFELKAQNIGIIITDHNVRETLNIVDRAYLIYEGKVLYSGSSSDLISDPDCRRVYFGNSFAL